ncbi:hypothetical protein SLS62_004587 [Diatrype stigma]|uniref:Heterokaryon incompatibility domain-containing protein n=1 Tax=Diatrype stigma TaxID=117547 RepID=A0AAN9YT17_9PEZI
MNTQAPWLPVAKMQGLCAGCALCELFAATILPNTYDSMPTGGPWHLRALCLKHAFIQNQDSHYFEAIPRVALYAGSSERDFFKFADSDRAREKGLLFAARTTDLQNYASIARSQEVPTTQLIPPKYSPDLVRHWVELSNSINDESSDADEDDQSQNIEKRPVKDLVVPATSIKAIDCETLEIVDCTTEAEYIALSYVWRLANDDLVPLRQCVGEVLNTPPAGKSLPLLIPRVVHNAMAVVMDLGYRYLWVDQYCIDQSASREEIIENISKMDLIYSLAQWTIVAASSRGALPGVGTTPRVAQEVLDLGGLTGNTENAITCFTTSPGVEKCILDSVWYTRGWCFQEATLSPRRLYFTDHEMYFDAENMWVSDSYPEPDFMQSHILCSIIHGELSLGVRSWEGLLEDRDIKNEYELDDPRGAFWVELEIFLGLMKEYLEKEMTFDGDVINGFTGVMKVFARQDPNFQTLQGLPVFGLSNHLQLKPIELRSTVKKTGGSESCHTLQQEDFEDFRKAVFVNVLNWHHEPAASKRATRRDGFPSWSWAGWKGMPSWEYMPKNIYSNSTEMGEVRFNVQAIESVSGKIIDFDEAPAYFSKETDDPMFLIGEAMEIPRCRLMESQAWNELLEKSKVARLHQDASSIYRRCMWLSNKVKQTSWASRKGQPVSREAKIEKLRTLSKIFRPSRLAKCFAHNTWRDYWCLLDSPEVFGSLLPENEKEEIARRLDDGRWSYLLISEVPGRANLLIVSWETASDGAPRVYNDNELRTGSRVGVVQILNHSEAERVFSDDNLDLPTVHFRLG